MDKKNSKKSYRYIEANELRADDDRKEIAGYFAVFDDEYKMFDHLTESIAPARLQIRSKVMSAAAGCDTGIISDRRVRAL